MPTGHTLVDMADDYATLVDEEFGGRVDLVIGHSTGGFIGFCLAAGHPDRFGHIVIAGAALWSQQADRANLEFSRLLVAGRTGEAGEHAARFLPQGIRAPGLATVLGVLLARANLTVAIAEDLLITAEALHAFDPEKVLPRSGVPVLLVAGDNDMYSTPEEVEQAAELIRTARCGSTRTRTTSEPSSVHSSPPTPESSSAARSRHLPRCCLADRPCPGSPRNSDFPGCG